MKRSVAVLVRGIFLVSVCASEAFGHEHTWNAVLTSPEEAGTAAHPFVAISPEEPHCALRIHLREAGSGRPLYGLIRVTLPDGDQPWVRLSGLDERPMGWFSIPPEAVVRVPQSKIRLEAIHGIETVIEERTLDLSGISRQDVTLSLERFYDPEAAGIRSGNTHLHLFLGQHEKMGVLLKSREDADRYLQVASHSDGLDLMYVSYLTNPQHHYVSNEYTDDDFRRFSRQEVLFVNGEEHRHGGKRVTAVIDGRQLENDSIMTYGHVLLLDLRRLVQPVSVGPGLTLGGLETDGVPLRRGIVEAREQGSAAIWSHGTFGLEDVPDWVDGLLDGQNIYDGANDGSIEEVFYSYLNAGIRVPFSTGTDWGIWDFSRVYVPCTGSITSKEFKEAMSAGRTFITNGPFLEFEAAGYSAGDTIPLQKPEAIRVMGRGLGRVDFNRLELVYNGDVVYRVNSRKVGRHYEADLDHLVRVEEPGWIALRIPPPDNYEIRSRYTGPGTNVLGKSLFAHTSPIYVTVGGRRIFRPGSARLLIEDMEDSLKTIADYGTFAGEIERQAILDIYQKAILTLEKRLEEMDEDKQSVSVK